MDLEREDNPKIDEEVDLEGELTCALDEMERLGKNKWLQKQKLKKYRKQILCTK